MSNDEYMIIAVDYVRHEFNATTPVASEPEKVEFNTLSPCYMVEVIADKDNYVVGIDEDGEVFAIVEYCK